MREILDDAIRWLADGAPIAIATVVGVRGSAPRGLGAAMVVSAAGQVRGNVSGGCVETAVVAAALEVIETGVPRADAYGIPDDDLFAVGLMCGGSIDVLLRAVRPGTPEAGDLAALASGEATAYALCVRGPRLGEGRALLHAERGISRDPAAHAPAARAAADASRDAGGDRPALVGYDADGCRTDAHPDRQYLVVPFAGPPRLVIVGAVQQAVALARLGAATGWAVTVVDPREAFTAAERFPGAEVVVDWPDRWLRSAALDARSAVCMLSHDERIDAPALQVALDGPAGYVGAMGSRRTHDDRITRLRATGVTEDQLERLHSPIGLDLGGRSPEETALSILAEIVAVRHGASGRPLSALHGPIHADAPA